MCVVVGFVVGRFVWVVFGFGLVWWVCVGVVD